jgi:hypothetical protein
MCRGGRCQSSAKASGCPAGLRAQLLLAHVVRPAAAALADAAAHHQHVDDAAVVHVHVVPVVHRGADDDHGLAVGLVGVLGELARDRDHLLARHAGDVLLPGRRVGHVVVVARGAVPRHPGHGRCRSWRRSGRTRSRPAPRSRRPAGSLGRHVCEPAARRWFVWVKWGAWRRRSTGTRPATSSEEPARVSSELDFLAAQRAGSRFQRPIPSPALAPAEADGAVRHHHLAAVSSSASGLPLGVVVLAEPVGQVGGAQHAAGT